jgi:CP family cyanate transporter-like MFS transporter
VSESRRDLQPAGWLAALIVLIGFQLRSVIVGVPPVLPELRADLHLSFSATGALTAIPVVCLGAAAIPGAILVNRFGARRVVGLATLALGATAILRITPPQPFSLYGWTALVALSIAAAQPAITVLVRNWFPGHVQQVSALYAMSLVLGGTAGAAVSVYLLAFGGWRATFVIWAGFALAAAGIWVLFAPGRGSPHLPMPHGLGQLTRDRRVWHVAGLFGSQSLVYYGGATWIPFLLRGYSHDYLALVLFLFQLASLPLIVVLSTIRRPWAGSRLWYSAGGLLMTVGSLALMLNMTGLAWLWALVIGLGTGMIFTGTTTLPALLAKSPSEVAGYAALVLTAGYAVAFVGPLLGGVLLDQTHILTSPFWVITASAAIATILGATLSTAPPALPRTE